jgi:hypothetical protein
MEAATPPLLGKLLFALDAPATKDSLPRRHRRRRRRLRLGGWWILGSIISCYTLVSFSSSEWVLLQSTASLLQKEDDAFAGPAAAAAVKQPSNNTTQSSSSRFERLPPPPPPPPKYDTIFTWPVDPEKVFDKTPYRQFCRWKKAADPSQKQRIATLEGWTTTQTVDDTASSKSSTNTLLDLKFDCYQTMRKSPLGAGNWVQILYLLRLAILGVRLPPASNTNTPNVTTLSRMDLRMSCIDDHRPANNMKHEQEQHNPLSSTDILPWLMGHFSSKHTEELLVDVWGNHNNNRSSSNLPIGSDDCLSRQWGEAPVGYMIPWIRYELRRMAVALVGVPPNDPTHPAHQWVKKQQQQQQQQPQQDRPHFLRHAYYRNPVGSAPDLSATEAWTTKTSPLLPHVQLDDVVIHFRCGDIMASRHFFFRFLKFKEFANRIDPKVESIGIVTQPFGGGKQQIKTNNNSSNTSSNHTTNEQARDKDHDDSFRVTICQRIVYRFVDYLQERFPKARISIHNGPDETIALAYARLIMAKRQAFAYPDSSFSVFPVLATFATNGGWHMYPTKSPYYKYPPKTKWLKDIVHESLMTTSTTDTAMEDDDDGGDGDGKNMSRIQFMYIDKQEALYAVETYQMRNEGPTSEAVIDTIVEWFANDTFVHQRISLK